MHEFFSSAILAVPLLIFATGMAWRIIRYVRGLDWMLDRVAYRPHLLQGLKGAAQSIAAWLVPFGTRSMRNAPVFTLCTFFFHIGVLFVPLFCLGHSVIVYSIFGFAIPAMPQPLADTLGLLAVISLAFLIFRRCFLPEARFLTTWREWLALALAGVPLVSGWCAANSLPGYEFWIRLHVASGVIFLATAPFTKLSHMVLFFLSRGQIGMDFAIKRGGEHRGSAFPW